MLRADDSAVLEGRGCYTSARVVGGRVRWLARHAQRLAQQARELGLGALDAETVEGALRELAAAAFPDRDGSLRFQASRDTQGGLHLTGLARELGPEPAEWSAIALSFASGALPAQRNWKLAGRLGLALAGEAARAAGCDEALLFDAQDQLIEGARSNLFVVDAQGDLCTPPLAPGAVAGLARSLLLERVPGIAERPLTRAEVLAAREVVATNAVRGAKPVTRLDAAPVGTGRPGAAAARLAAALETAD